LFSLELDLLEAHLIAKDGGESGLLVDLGTLEEAEGVDVKDVTLGGLGGDAVQLDVVDLLANTEGVDGGLLLETAGLDLEDWWITGTAVSDEKDLVGDLGSVTELGLEGVVDNPLDGQTGVGTATGVDNGVDGLDGLGVVLHLVHVEAELWATVVGDQTDTDSGLAQVGLQEEVVDKVLHLLEVLGTD